MDNTTSQPLKIKKSIDKIYEDIEADNEEYLNYYQKIVKEFLIKRDVRGLLVYHATGVGKSRTASAIADYYRKYEPKRRIIILLPKSLQSNFRLAVKKFMKMNKNNSAEEKRDEYIDDIIDKKYNFVSMNSSSMFKNMEKTSKSDLQLEEDSVFSLDNSLLIIDEFHNLSNSITNGSKNAVNLYRTIMNARNVKLVFLTGTPIVNNAFELVPTFNLLKGYIDKKNTLFPEVEEEFNRFFISDGRIKNKDRFQNRIIGLVSYYGDVYFGNKTKEGFPEQFNLIVEKVHMSPEQYERYRDFREIELKEESNKFKRKNTNTRFSPKEDSKSISSYRIRSRQASNYLIPNYAYSAKSGIKGIDKIKEEDLTELEIFSPKIKRMLDNIKKHPDQLGLIYTEFVSGEGIAILRRIFPEFGYPEWTDKKEEYVLGGGTSKSISKKFAIISGNVEFSERQKIINVFNSEDNQTGKLIYLLIISKSGAEGLSLHNVRHIHLLEPFWNYARIEQVIARGVRFLSHKNLPKKEQNVQPYIYLSIPPKGKKEGKESKKIKSKTEEDMTTDETIFKSAIDSKIIRDDFEIAMIESSIDCSINTKKNDIKDFNCYLCDPTDEQLYNIDLTEEMKSPNNCKLIKSGKKVKAKEIIMEIDGDEKKFYYVDDKIYTFSEEIDDYKLLKKNSPLYADIMRKVLFAS
jgi:superfamily II DNA or RNA helicase